MTWIAPVKGSGFILNVRRPLSPNPPALRGYTRLSSAVYPGGILLDSVLQLL